MSLRLYFPLPLSNFTPHPFIKTAFLPPPLNCFGFFIFKIIFSVEVVEYGKGDNLKRTQIWSNFCYLHKVSHLTQPLLSPILGGILQTRLHIVAEVYWFFPCMKFTGRGGRTLFSLINSHNWLVLGTVFSARCISVSHASFQAGKGVLCDKSFFS